VHRPKHEEDDSDRQHGLINLWVGTVGQVVDRSGKYGDIEATVMWFLSMWFLDRVSHSTD